MNTYMNDKNIKKLDQIRQFLLGTKLVEFKSIKNKDRYRWIAKTLKRFDYHKLRKKDKGTVREYIIKISGYSRQQITRLISQHRESNWIGRRKKARWHFPKTYTQKDIKLLAETDKYHNTLSGHATKKLFERAYIIYQEEIYKRLANISVSHIYNLRATQIYIQNYQHFTKTKHTSVAIGERRKPEPNGEPGYLRIDTVHQGDLDKEKGVYHINAVDEVTQMEVICSVERISENFLIPVLEQLINEFPFIIKGIHADNGSEYINKIVANLLQKLLIELTKSRARHSNDNALVESKNGALVRKHLGYMHINQKWAPAINNFCRDHLNPYINFHRPCFFPVTTIDDKGKQKKLYPYKAMMTPYEKFKSLPNAEKYLKREITFVILDKIANKITDLEAAKEMHKARTKLFDKIDTQNLLLCAKFRGGCE
jgi:transposase InsO family protein